MSIFSMSDLQLIFILNFIITYITNLLDTRQIEKNGQIYCERNICFFESFFLNLGIYLWYFYLNYEFIVLIDLVSFFLIFCGFIIFIIYLNGYIVSDDYDNDLFVIIELCFLGFCMVLWSTSFLELFLSFELSVFSIYILIGFDSKSVKSLESSLKYFLISGVGSGFFLFGISILYGVCGSLDFEDIRDCLLIYSNLSGEVEDLIVLYFLFFSIICINIGFFFKLGVVPFHLWLPDVYEGSSFNILSILIGMGKIPIVFIFLEFNLNICSDFFYFYNYLLLFIAFFSIIVGSIGSLWQLNLKRWIAYSSIAHTGFIILTVVEGNFIGIYSSYFYLFVYVITSLNFLSIVVILRSRSNYKFIEKINEFKNIGNYFSLLSFVLLVNIFTFSGLPPFSGFFSKLFILNSFINNEYFYIILFFIIVITSVLGAVYYLRFINFFYFEKRRLQSKRRFFFTPVYGLSYFIVFTLFFNIFLIFFIVF